MRKHLLWCGLAAMAWGCSTEKHSRFDRADFSKPDFFPILPWDPYRGWDRSVVKGRVDGLESIAQCNFNMAGFIVPKDLPRCQKLGLGAILLPTDATFTNVQNIYEWRKLTDGQIDGRVKFMVAAAKASPAVVGYFITDEPGAADFPALAKAVAAVKKYAPGKLAYINLFPDYATMGSDASSQLGAASYREYLERFVAEVHPQVLSYDNYMVQYSRDLRDSATAASYYRNMLEVRRVGLEHRLPFMNIVASCQLRPDATIPSPADLLFQACTTLAAGYRGITWYTYFGDFYPYAPIAKTGERTATWAAVREANRQIATLAPIMSRLESTGVFFSAPPPASGLPILPGELIQSAACPTPVMVGEFKDKDGGRFAMIVNLSLEQSAAFKLKPVSPEIQISVISAVDCSKTPFDSKTGLWLTPGQGVLLALEN
ncbi:MAG TPA: hypothetical protein VGO59_10075 [Verrucomicrobiae bacterium]